MTESMKFGPEWLRNMSSDIGGGGQSGQSGGGMSNLFGQNNNININSSNNNSNLTISAPKYQLAEYRYGREEMLLLCDKARIPEILPKYKKLFVEKFNGPLALTPSTDDDAVTYERTPWVVRGVQPTIGISSRGGRGGSIERGRGRGRGSYHSTLGYQRSSSMYDEDARGGGRAPWLDRNGTDATEWNGGSSTSPRKEYITRNSSMESWRRSRDDDSTSTTATSTTTVASDTWRGIGPSGATTGYKWARSQSWRDEESTIVHNSSESRPFSNTSDRNSGGPNGKLSLAGSTVRKPLHTWNDEEKLPEWASEDPIEGGGTFDSSGAFHGTQEDDDGQATDSNVRNNRRTSPRTDDSNPVRKESSQEPTTTPKSRANQSNTKESIEQKANAATDGVDDKKTVPTSESDKKRTSKSEQNDVVNHQNKKLDGAVEDANKENSSATGNMANDTKRELNPQPISSESTTMNASIDDIDSQQQFMKIQSMLQSQQKQGKLNRPPMSESASVDRMQEVADDMVKNLISDDEMSSNERDVSGPAQSLLLNRSENISPHQSMFKDPQFTPTQSDQWLYEDPQGKIQGPFTATEMTEWYRAGYFDENLLVRQVFETCYSALGDLVKQRGSLPFGTSAPLAHAMKNDLSSSHVSHEIPHANIPQVKPTPNPVPMLPSEFQFLQQKALMMKLAEDPWSLMSAEQQAANKGMDINDYLMPPTAMNAKQSQALGIPPNINHPKHPILKQQQPSPANQPTMFTNHDFIASNSASPPDASSALNRLMQQISLNQHQTPLTIPMQHQPPPQPSPQNQYDAIQSLMMQLAMQKVPSTGLVTMPNNNQHPIDKNSPNNGGWMGTNIGVVHQQANLGQPPNNAAASSWATNRIWPIQMPPMPANALKLPTTINQQQQQQQQQMKTEKQIRDELKKDEPKKEDLINWKIPNLTVQQQQQQQAAQQQHLQQVAQQQQQQQQQLQQQLIEKQMLEKQREEKRKRDTDSEKRTKAEEDKQKQSKKDTAKSDGSGSKKDAKADDKKKENDEKKRQKELKKQQAEDERRRQQEEEKRRQSIEEQKRLDDIAEQRKAKLMEGQRRAQQNDQNQSMARQNANASIAPWSMNPVAQVAKPSLSLAEIQKAERERRAEQSRIEQLIREQQQTQSLLESRQQKESTQKWNLQPHSVKSLAEIQAEESVKRQSISDQIALNSLVAASVSAKKREADQAQQNLSSIWNTNTPNAPAIWNAAAAKMWSNGSSTSSGGFWEEPNKSNVRMSNSIANVSAGHSGNAPTKTLVKSQTVSNMQQAAAKSTSKLQANASKPIAKTNSSVAVPVAGVKIGKSGKKDREASENSNQEFNVWCFKALASHENAIDVPTFVSFLKDLESPFEVKDYIRMYLGETKECTEFAKQFLERRSKYKNQQRAANAHIDDMCSPAPAITPSNDFQEVKGKGKKEKKKNKMLKLDSRILGFSVTAAQDRLNVGDRDYSYGDAP